MITMTTPTTTTTRTVHQTTFDLNEFSCIQVDGFCVRAFCVAGFLVASSPSCSFCPLLLMLSFELPQHQVKLHRNYASTGLYGVLKCSFVFYTFYQHQHHPFIRRWWVRKNPFLVLFGFAHFFSVHIDAKQSLFHTIFLHSLWDAITCWVCKHTHIQNNGKFVTQYAVETDYQFWWIKKNLFVFRLVFDSVLESFNVSFFGIRFGSFGL